MIVTATELKNRLGRYLDEAEVEPVMIEKSGRKKAVLMAYRQYEALTKGDDTTPTSPGHVSLMSNAGRTL